VNICHVRMRPGGGMSKDEQGSRGAWSELSFLYYLGHCNGFLIFKRFRFQNRFF